MMILRLSLAVTLSWILLCQCDISLGADGTSYLNQYGLTLHADLSNLSVILISVVILSAAVIAVGCCTCPACSAYKAGGQVAPEDRATALQHRADLAELIGFEKSRASLSRTPKLVRELVHLGIRHDGLKEALSSEAEKSRYDIDDRDLEKAGGRAVLVNMLEAQENITKSRLEKLSSQMKLSQESPEKLSINDGGKHQGKNHLEMPTKEAAKQKCPTVTDEEICAFKKESSTVYYYKEITSDTSTKPDCQRKSLEMERTAKSKPDQEQRQSTYITHMNNRIAYPAQNDGGARELDERSYATIRLSKSASPDTNLTKDQTNLPLFHSQNDAVEPVTSNQAGQNFDDYTAYSSSYNTSGQYFQKNTGVVTSYNLTDSKIGQVSKADNMLQQSDRTSLSVNVGEVIFLKRTVKKRTKKPKVFEPVDIVVDSPTDQPVKEENNLGQKVEPEANDPTGHSMDDRKVDLSSFDHSIDRSLKKSLETNYQLTGYQTGQRNDADNIQQPQERMFLLKNGGEVLLVRRRVKKKRKKPKLSAADTVCMIEPSSLDQSVKEETFVKQKDEVQGGSLIQTEDSDRSMQQPYVLVKKKVKVTKQKQAKPIQLKQRQVYQGSESQSESENSSRFMQIPVKSNIVDLHEMIPPRKPPSPKMTMIKRKGEIGLSTEVEGLDYHMKEDGEETTSPVPDIMPSNARRLTVVQMGLQTLMQSHTLDDDSNQHMQQSFVGNETHMTTDKMHTGNQREVGDSQAQGRLGTKRIQRITAEKTVTENIDVAPVMPVRQSGAAASKTLELSGTAETSNIMFHHNLQNPSETHTRKADTNEFFGDSSFRNYTIAAQQGQMEEYLTSFKEELDNATLRAKEHAIQKTNYVAERKSTGHTLAQRLSISIQNERESGYEIRHQQQVEAAERGLVTDIHHLLPVGVHAETKKVSRVLHQGAAGIQTEVDALGYWQKDNPNQTFKMEPESVDILYSTTHMTKAEDHRPISSMTGATTQLPYEKPFTSAENRHDSALELSPGSQEMDHSEDPMQETTQDHLMALAPDERMEFPVTSGDDIGNMKREVELSMENEKISFRAQLRRDLERRQVEATIQEKHEKSTVKNVKTTSTVSQRTSRKSETNKLKRDSKISIHSITEQVNKSAWSSQRQDSSQYAKLGHEQGVVTATSVLSSKKHHGKVVLAKTDVLAGKKRSSPVKPEAMAVEPSSDIVEAHQFHRDVPFAATTNMETSKSNIHAEDTSQIPVTTKLNPKELPEEIEAQNSDEILEKNTESRKSKAFSAFFTALDIREGGSGKPRPLESTEPMEQQAENIRALHHPRGTATRTEIMQEDYFTRVDGIQRPRISEKPGFSVYFRSKESASDDATDSYNSLQVMPSDGNVDTGIIELNQTLDERHERRDTSSAGIQRKLTSVEAAMKTEVSAGLHEAHCDHADFSDYTILDPMQTNPTEKLD